MNEEKKEQGFGAENWSKLISGLGSGIQTGLQGSAQNSASKRELKESKRRTLANMLNKAYGRSAAMGRAGQEYGDEMTDFNSRAMQQVAQGFIKALL